jgi:signal transduction histidine kinase
VTLQRALLLLIATALLAGIIPAGVALDRRLEAELESRAREELALAPRVLADRNTSIGAALMMSAKDLSGVTGIADALARGAPAEAYQRLEAARGPLGDEPVLMDSAGNVWRAGGRRMGTYPELVEETRGGEMPVTIVADSVPRIVALAGVRHEGRWVGATGVTRPFDASVAGTLAGLTRSTVIILGAGGHLAATSVEDTAAMQALAEVAREQTADGRVRELRAGGRRYLVTATGLGDAATVAFVRDLDRELAVLPKLRQVEAMAGAAALLFGLVLGAVFALRIARPMTSLADASDRLAAGDFAAPLAPSRIREIDRVSEAFDGMRRALAGRLEELQQTNRELADREERLTALQAEFIQRERLAASGRMVAELAHEIRNPVASLRNCLELLLRRLDDDPRGQEFANLAIDELLRMHELAERMLDLNRPRDPDTADCDALAVVREAAALVDAGARGDHHSIHVTGDPTLRAAIPPDALKQVLLNLVYNAREAVPHGLDLEIRAVSSGSIARLEVTDNGPGIPEDVLPQVFDPFFTTKSNTGGVGLGLSVADGIVRKYGGRISAENLDGGGARFRIDLPRLSGKEQTTEDETAAAETEVPT